jgi:hypothetical protein
MRIIFVGHFLIVSVKLPAARYILFGVIPEGLIGDPQIASIKARGFPITDFGNDKQKHDNSKTAGIIIA